MSQPDTVTVFEVEDPTVTLEQGVFQVTHYNDKGGEQGNPLVILTNGRRLFFGSDGMYDADDLEEDGSFKAGRWPGNVNWEELLQLLDGWRNFTRN